MYYYIDEYSKTLSYYKNSLETQQQALRSDQLDLASSYDNIARLHEQMGDYSKALALSECAVNIAQQSLLENHPDFRKWKEHLEIIKTKNKIRLLESIDVYAYRKSLYSY